MKSISVRDLQKRIKESVDASQRDRVVVTRNGRPAAIIIGVDGEDWESVVRQSSRDFWKLIERRRKERTISLDEVRDRFKE